MELAPQQQAVPDGKQPGGTKKRRSPAARFLRGVCWLLFSPIILFLVLTLLFYIPFVQDWAVGLACEKISEATGLDVKVERLRVVFPLDVDLQQLCITQSGATDTVLAVNSCLVDLDLCGLFGGSVGVDAVDLDGVVADTHDLIASMTLKGRLSSFRLDAHDLEVKDKRVNITAAALRDCDLDIALRDTTIIDTTTNQPLDWRVDFANIELSNARIAFHTANDTLSVRAGLRDCSLERGHFDLGAQKLQVEDLRLKADSVWYDQNYVPRQDGLDFNHLRLYDISTRLRQLDYDLDAGSLCLALPLLKLREQAGVQLDELSADLCLDTLGVKVGEVVLNTPNSHLKMDGEVEWGALNPTGKGSLDVTLSADVNRDDLLLLAGRYLPASVSGALPDKRYTAEVDVEGNVADLDVRSFRVELPGMLSVKVAGKAGNLLENDRLAASLEWDVRAQDLSLVQQIAGLDGIRLPALDLTGTTTVRDGNYEADMLLRQGQGWLTVKGAYAPKADQYRADIEAQGFALSNFVAMDSACVITASAHVDGKGYDLFSNRTNLRAVLDIPSARYGSLEVGNARLDAQLRQGRCWANFYSGSDIIDADGCVELKLDRNRIDSAAFAFDMRGLDLYMLGVTKKPFKASMTMHMNGNTNLKDVHYLKGDVTAMQLSLKDTTFYPRDIALETLLNPDTTYAFVSAGDLLFRLNSNDGLATLMDKGTAFADSLTQQMERKQFDQRKLVAMLPVADLCIKTGSKNPAANMLLSMTGYSYKEMDVDFHTDPITGINGEGYVYSTNTGKIVLDTINFKMRQDSVGTMLNAQICNNRKNKDVTFDARLQAALSPGQIGLDLLYFDSQHRKGVDLGAQLRFHNGERRLHLTPLRPVLAYRNFTLNEDNYVALHRDGHIEANLDMLADDGTGLKLFSSANEDADQDLTLSLNHLNLGELCSVMPYMPAITGFLNGDLHYLKQGDISSIMADLIARNMAYEGYRMGDIGINAAYMPNEDGSHFVDGYLSQDANEVLSFVGTYTDRQTTDDIDAVVTLQRFPASLANGFLGETMQLTGYLLGDLNVTGSSDRPRVNGTVRTDALHLLSPLYSIDMRIEDDEVEVKNSKLNFNQINGYTTGTAPMTLDGTVDFADLGKMQLDIRAKAKNFELINAPKNRKAVAYGKVYVDLDARARGPVQNLSVTGKLGVLGNTNVTYVLLDSPITVEDEMSDLVTFCDFSDTVQVEETVVVPPNNLKMQMQINIDQRANVNCLLSQDGANYIKLEGGGDLNMTYDAVRGMQLFGRYTILQGKMTYTLMVVSLKDCEIKNGSYVEFAGDISNPRLKIDASERVNSTLTENGNPRTVGFDVGLSISQTLSNMGLAFTLDAPEDMNVQNAIAQMTEGQRSRVAVTLMATGMYIVEGQGSNGFNTANALNTFLQSQISSITGKALSSFDLSLGVQNNATASGSTTTDYSFRFAKRFWGNRISLIVGGKVSSGRDAQNTGESIIDNVSIEYRLDRSATRYVTLFYDNNNESVLEGKVIEMGAGLVLRRKTNHLGELFLFNNKKKEEEQ
ncbi:MAG: translocation/assembly module TamB domain-containing protein [Bacteroidaceae bacterium]|nr:translocation/assembly module TamB domain-containing protein [Bacteroidaceae bacterium]